MVTVCQARNLLAALMLVRAAVAMSGTTWYVNGSTGSDTNSCRSATAACRTIGHAISLAATGDSVMVAAATYAEHLSIDVSLNLVGASASSTTIDGAPAHCANCDFTYARTQRDERYHGGYWEHPSSKFSNST